MVMIYVIGQPIPEKGNVMTCCTGSKMYRDSPAQLDGETGNRKAEKTLLER